MQLKVASRPRGDPKFKDCLLGTSPEVQLAMQGAQFRSLVRELAGCHVL